MINGNVFLESIFAFTNFQFTGINPYYRSIKCIYIKGVYTLISGFNLNFKIAISIIIYLKMIWYTFFTFLKISEFCLLTEIPNRYFWFKKNLSFYLVAGLILNRLTISNDLINNILCINSRAINYTERTFRARFLYDKAGA